MLFEHIHWLETKLEGFNKRILYFEDITSIAASLRLTVVGGIPEKWLKSNGMLLLLHPARKAYICIKKAPYQQAWFVGAHELGHFLLHISPRLDLVPFNKEILGRVERRMEEEAGLFATMCMLPNPLLKFWENNDGNSDLHMVCSGFVKDNLGISKLSEQGETNIRNRLRCYEALREMMVANGQWDSIEPMSEPPDVKAHIHTFLEDWASKNRRKTHR